MSLRVKNSIFVTLVLLTSWSQPCAFGQDVFEIDNSHTSTLFSVSHFNIGYVYGRFNTCSGKVTMNRDEPNQSQFELKIDTKSVDTNDIGRDNHLRGADFFNVENHPSIEFKSTSVKVDKGNYQVTGKFKMLDVEKNVTIPFQLLGVGKGPFGNTRMGMIAKFSIKRSEFGMTKMLDSIGDEVAITLSFEGILK